MQTKVRFYVDSYYKFSKFGSRNRPVRTVHVRHTLYYFLCVYVFVNILKACKNKQDEQVFVKILSTVSFPQLYATFACFAEMANESMESIAKKHLSGNILLTCLTMSINNGFL